jgi:hypothetical protein
MSIFDQKPQYAFVKINGRFVRIDRDPIGKLRSLWRKFSLGAMVVVGLATITGVGLYVLAWITRTVR